MLTGGTESSDSDEHFSDAHSGLGESGTNTPVRQHPKHEKDESTHSHEKIPEVQENTTHGSDVELDEVTATSNPNNPETLGKVEVPEAQTHNQGAGDTMLDIVSKTNGRESSDHLSQVNTQSSNLESEGKIGGPDLTDEAKDTLGMSKFVCCTSIC